jgi:hypothetical protein
VSGFRFGDESNYRDASHLGNCDDSVEFLASLYIVTSIILYKY